MAGERLAMLSRLNEYIRVTEGENAKSLGERYSAFIEMLESLNNNVMSYYRMGENGEYPTLQPTDAEKLKKLYSTVLVAADELLGRKKPNKAEKRYNVVVKQIRNLLDQDAEVINGISADDINTLPAMVRRARSRQVTVEAEKVETVGEMSSQRIPLAFTDENGIERRGFFSEIHTLEFDSEKVSKKYVEDMLKKHEKDNWPYKDVFNAILRRGTFGFELITDLTVLDPNLPGVYTDFLRKCGLSAERAAELKDDMGLNRELNALSDIAVKTERNMFSYESGTEGSGIESRNNAFSAVAEAFGRGNIIAKAEGMELTLNGEKLHGSFMETASGSDCHRPTANDPMVTWAKNGVKKDGTGLSVSPDALRQLADLDVLDYICGNRDRHSGNMLYQFDTSDPAKPVLVGITGIDNDRSFLVSEPDEKAINLTQLKDIRYISKSMADKIMGMTKAELSLRLADKQLSEAEKDAAFARVEEMQRRIRKGAVEFGRDDDLYEKKDGAVRVLSDEQFAQLDFNRLVGKDPNVKDIFGRTVDGAKSAICHHEKSAEKNGFEESRIKYNAASTRGFRPDGTQLLGAKLNGFRDDLINNDHFYLINSSKFDDMKKSLNDLRNAVNEGFTDESELEELYSDLSRKCQIYIDAKGNLPATEYGQNRLETARQMRDYVNERIATINDPMAQSLGRSEKYAGEFRHKLFMCSLTGKDLQEANKNFFNSKNRSQALLDDRSRAKKVDDMYFGLLKENAANLFAELKAQDDFKKTFDPACFAPDRMKEIKEEIGNDLFLEKYCADLRNRPGAEAITPDEFFKDISKAKEEYDAPSEADEEEKVINISVLE